MFYTIVDNKVGVCWLRFILMRGWVREHLDFIVIDLVPAVLLTAMSNTCSWRLDNDWAGSYPVRILVCILGPATRLPIVPIALLRPW